MSTIKAKFFSAPINGATVEPLSLQTNNVDRLIVDSTGNYTFSGNGAVTFGTGTLNIGSGQIVKDSAGNVGIGISPDGTAALQIEPGTASIAPVKLTSGTILSTAGAGAIEYDGKLLYGTPQGTQRGILPTQMFYRLNANLAGTNATGVQSMFGVGATLSASTVYAFEIVVVLNKTAGTTSHTVSQLFGGTATLNNILFRRIDAQFTTALPQSGTASLRGFSTATTNVVTTAITSAASTLYAVISGTVSVNAAGTFIPQYSLSAAPGGAYSTLAGSYICIWPVGAAGANINIGGFA